MFLFLVSAISASDVWHLDSQKVSVGFSMSEELEVVPLSDSYRLDYINAKLTMVPEDSFQQSVSNLDTRPKAEISDGALFSWHDVQTDRVRYELTADIELSEARLEVTDKVDFPIGSLPDDVRPFLQPSETIDLNYEMALLASRIIEGEDDLFFAVAKIGGWVEANVGYDLSTLAADASMKSSWVLENRYGVCDEITSLFISLLRSVGIPARFVSGIAYTNSPQFDAEWGPHGWAEVYFPGVGWIPYDITYDQFGFVDPAHIILKQSLDSGEPSSKYEWRGHNVDIIPKAVDFDVRLRSHDGDQPDRISINVYPHEDAVGFGSYQLIVAEVENLADYYITETLYVSGAEILTALDTKMRVSLGPDERKRIFFILKTDEDLNKGYEYTVPVTVYTQYGLESRSSFALRYDRPVFSLEDIEDIRSSLQDTESKNYRKEVSLYCTAEKRLLVNVSSDIGCMIKNTGNQILEDVDACYQDQCEVFDLSISQERPLVFSVRFDRPGENAMLVSIRDDYFSKAFTQKVKVFDRVGFDVGITAPDSVAYGGLFDVDVVIRKTSVSVPKYLSVTLEAGRYGKTVDIEELQDPVRYVYRIGSKHLAEGENEIRLRIAYQDGDEWAEFIEKDYISLDDLTFFQRFMIRIRNIFD
ncbi:transglutaminase domain-containing protein [Candidatus Woesearchaeota archaeon]|nr:transglutaminase domain-containing protein [Candidatus Woesearchaeota archaeon]